MIARTKTRLFLGSYAVIYAVGVLIVCGAIPSWGEWYIPDAFFRQQSDAILRGQLALSHNPADLELDLAWSEGGVQQVWGLGIPLWRLPFDLIARLFSARSFPDKLVEGAFIALMAFRVLTVFILPTVVTDPKHSKGLREFFVSLGSASLLLAFPPFLSLLGASQVIHNEVLVYVYSYGLILACGLVSITRFPSWRRFWALSALAGVGALVRPTLLFYGIATLITALVLILTANRQSVPLPSLKSCVPRVAVGVALFIAGGLALWLTNALRFGNGFEFGHSLNVQPDELLRSVYATRFDHPYQNEPFWSAFRELLGALFRANRLNGNVWYAKDIFVGQSPTMRMRDFSFSTYDISYFLLVIAGWIVGLLAVLRAWSAARNLQTIPTTSVLAVWSLLATVPLGWFYLRTPPITSRYMMDFAPAFAVAMVVAWERLGATLAPAHRKIKWVMPILFAALLIWLGCEIACIKHFPGSKCVSWNDVFRDQQDQAGRQKIKDLPSGYSVGDDLSTYGIPFNGSGWDQNNGEVGVCVILFVDSPECLELELTSPNRGEATRRSAELIRAKVGLELLKQKSLERTKDGWRIGFAGPKTPRYQHGVQPIFIATVSKDQLAESTRSWVLESVTWRCP